jgi:HlyD family secretion protein
VANGKNHKNKRWIIITAVSVAVVALVIVAVAATRGGTKIDPIKLAKVEKGDLAKSVVATGKITPITKVEIKSKASGIVEKLYVDTGDHVKQGQVLAELDRVEIQAQVNSSKAQLLSSQANLKSAEADEIRAKLMLRAWTFQPCSGPTSARRRCPRMELSRRRRWTMRSGATSWP